MRLNANILSTGFLYILGLISSYFLTAIIIKFYGTEQLGIFTTTTRLLKLLEVFCLLGMNISIVKFVSEDLLEKKRNIFPLYSFSAKKIILISLPISIIIFLSSGYLANSIFGNEKYVMLFKAVSIVLPFSSLKLLNEELLRSLSYFKISEFFKRFGLMFFTIIIFFLFQKNDDINFTVTEYYLSIICVLFFVSSFYVLSKILTFSYTRLDSELKQNYKNISNSLFLSLFILTLNSQQTIYLLESFSSSSNVGIFQFYFRIAALCSFPKIISNNILGPQIAPLLKDNKLKDLQSKINNFVKYSTGLTLAISLLIYILHEHIFLYFGEEFLTYKNVFNLILFSQIFNVLTGPCTLMLQMGNNQKILLRNNIIGLLIGLILNTFLIMNYGLSGAGLGFALSIFILNIMNVFSVKKIYNISTIFKLKNVS